MLGGFYCTALVSGLTNLSFCSAYSMGVTYSDDGEHSVAQIGSI